MTTYKVIIAGGRTFNDYELMCDKLDKILSNITLPITVVSGTAGGADKMGERYAKDRGYNVLRMPADWKRYGKSAGYRRNEEMARVANGAVCFWDGDSRGTKHMIDLSVKYSLNLRVVRY